MIKLALPFLFFILFNECFSQSPLKVGDKAPDFELVGVDDKTYSLSDMKDKKGYVVIFTCNHCPYSVAYEDRIIQLQKDYEPKGYQVIAINPNDPAVNADDSFAKMKIRANEKSFNFPYLFDEGQKVYPKYGATRTPHVFFLDSNLIVKYIGAIDDSTEPSGVDEKFLENALIAHINNVKIEMPFTKAIGCTIKRKK